MIFSINCCINFGNSFYDTAITFESGPRAGGNKPGSALRCAVYFDRFLYALKLFFPWARYGLCSSVSGYERSILREHPLDEDTERVSGCSML